MWAGGTRDDLAVEPGALQRGEHDDIRTPLTFAFSAAGAVIWLALVVVLTRTACRLRARNACQTTIRETLAYE